MLNKCKVVPAVVVLRTTATRAFDTQSATSGHATGFVVDKRRGIILTNRHVVKPGPVTAEAMFVNREEIPVYPIYRDPVHDFGFFRYDPAAVKFLSYEEIPLAPEAASVGLEIRVVGNDSREKISILAGTLARLDRDAPHYKKDGYNDCNTFYIQVPGGPAYDHLEPGDVLVRMNGEFARGGTSLTVQLVVEDLHSITPNYFLEVSGGVIHPLSYQQARNFRFPCGLVYVSKPGYMLHKAGVQQHAIIKRLANEDVSNLEDFINVLSKLSRGARVPLEYINYKDRHRTESVIVTVDRHEWYASPQIYTRDDNSGIWIRKPALPSDSQLTSSAIIQVANGVAGMNISSSEHVIAEVEDSTSPGDIVVSNDHDTSSDSGNASVAERVIEPTLVMLTVSVPSSCMVDGVNRQYFTGTGVIIYHSEEMGLVAVDKNTVAISASDVMLSFAALPIEIPGEVVFLHPVHNYALIAYDPSVIEPAGNSLVRAAELLPEPALHRGESVYLVGLSKSLQAKSRKSVVTNPSATLKISSADSPEVIELNTHFGSNFTGVLTDEHGRVKALWGSFPTQIKYGENSSKGRQLVRGIPIHSISQVLNEIISGAKGPSLVINGIKRRMPLVRVLEVEFCSTLLSKARSFGLTTNWIQALVKKDPVRRQVLRVKGCLAGSKAENLLKQGDMVLAINKKIVTCFNDIEDACHAMDVYDDMDAKLELTIFRQGHEMQVKVGTDVRDGNGTTHV
uniref:Putative PDZ domain, Peptidase S1, PA clan, PDZ-like domain protein n=1 Tax=Helianthus annuus TaxID=4232 RepID=A0A251TWW5_HELAN